MIELFSDQSDPTMINGNLNATVIGNDGNPVEVTRVCVVHEGSINWLLATSVPFTKC